VSTTIFRKGAGSRNNSANSKTVGKIKNSLGLVKQVGLRLDRSESSDESEGSDLITVKSHHSH